MFKKILITICAIILCAGCGYCIYRVYNAETVPPTPAADYGITYYIDGVAVELDLNKYTAGQAVELAAAPAKTGYAFGGWYDNPYYTGTAVTTVSAATVGDVKLYAKYTAIVYTVNFVGADIEPITYTYGQAVTLPAPAVELPTVFEGFYSDEDFTKPITAILASDYGNKTIFVKLGIDEDFLQLPLTLSTEIDDIGLFGRMGLYGFDFDFTKNYTLAIETKDIASGYTEELTVLLTNITINELEDGNVIIFDFSDGNDYLISLAYNCGGLDDSAEGYYYQAGYITILSVWGDTPLSTIITITDITVSDDFTITFEGADVAGLTYTYGDTVELPIPAAPEGYIFVGWSDAAGNIVPGIVLGDFSNKIFYAVFELEGYTVNFNNASEVDVFDTIFLKSTVQTVYTISDSLAFNNNYMAVIDAVAMFGASIKDVWGIDCSDEAVLLMSSAFYGTYIFFDTDGMLYFFIIAEIMPEDYVINVSKYSPVFIEPDNEVIDVAIPTAASDMMTSYASSGSFNLTPELEYSISLSLRASADPDSAIISSNMITAIVLMQAEIDNSDIPVFCNYLTFDILLTLLDADGKTLSLSVILVDCADDAGNKTTYIYIDWYWSDNIMFEGYIFIDSFTAAAAA